MLWALWAAATVANVCSTNTIEMAAQSLIKSLSNRDFACIRSMMINPSLKFDGKNLDPAVLDSLNFRRSGRRSYFDIVGDGIIADYIKDGNKASVFLISKNNYENYLRDKSGFIKKYFMVRYFGCSFKKIGSEWKLTEDFCFTESEF